MNLRVAFYNINPILGYIWVEVLVNSVLVNSDDFIAPGYDMIEHFRDEVAALKAMMTFLNKKLPKYITGPIEMSIPGSEFVGEKGNGRTSV